MKWIYGKRDWDSIERGQENCYLMTNGLGGFSMLTMIGSAARSEHSVLMACTQAPNRRYNMVCRLAEQVIIGEEEYDISSQEFADGHREEGCRYLYSFEYEDTPVWKFLARGVEIRKEAGMKRGKNAVGIRYEICNRGNSDCIFRVIPFYRFAPKGRDLMPGQKLIRTGNRIDSGELKLYIRTSGEIKDIEEREEIYYYRYDQCDGRKAEGTARADHCIVTMVEAGKKKSLDIIFEMEISDVTAKEVIDELKQYRSNLVREQSLKSEMAKTLLKSAEQFISARASTGGETILAGFPFFEDWGRDTMIALPGICLAGKRYETAQKILRTFAVNEKDGLMPNLFPEGKKDPQYNTVDAALLFINCVYLLYCETGNREFILEMYPVMERIINKYRNGTKFGICMDEDGLIRAGEGLDQLTWMDVRIGEILPTPRHGKPVEINAYWYNALCIMSVLAQCVGIDGSIYAEMSERTKASFIEKFWMKEKRCLKDVISGTKADTQVRCNQIWAVSMPFTMLDKEKERQIVETVFEKLYTPYGLRTLEEEDEEFCPYYRGEMAERDLAYHQGTIWVFPLGAYYLAYLKVHDYSEEAKETVRNQLEVMDSMLREGCIGQLPEIYDGKNPTFSRGCYAQAWSVGEMIRVYEKVEQRI